MPKSKISKFVGIALVVAILLGLTAAMFAGDASSADGFAFVADSYGGRVAEELWYYQEDALGLYEAKEFVDGFKGELEKDDPIVIAVVDTGMTASHELFDDVLLKNAEGNVLGFNSVTAQTDGQVDISDKSEGRHGNAVAGIIAMLIRELELEDYIKIYPIKASQKNTVNGKQTDTFSIESITRAISWAAQNGADVINLSLGRQGSETDEWAKNANLAFEINRASASALIVAAAGNNEKNSSEDPFYPAALDGVFSVMGYGQDGELYDRSNFGALYDIAAPAEGIYTAYDKVGSVNDYREDNGTSMAAPIASFAAALLQLRLRAEGRENVDPSEIARLLKSFDFQTLMAGGAEVNKLSLLTAVSQPLDEVEIKYNYPTGIRITHDAKTGEGELADSVYFADPRDLPEIHFVANLTPYGMTDPDYNAAIVWSVKTADGTEREVGRGQYLTLRPVDFGKTELIARLRFDVSVTGSQKICIDYLKFVAGDARVTFERYADSRPADAPTSGTIYTGETTVFSFTGAKYLDPSVEIKWYVDREFVATGRTFVYRPTSTGEHIIGVQYGDNPPTHLPGIAFVATVKPFILRPLDLSMLIIAIVIVVGGAAAVVALKIKRDREKNPCEPKQKKPKKQKPQKPDKDVKIAKR